MLFLFQEKAVKKLREQSVSKTLINKTPLNVQHLGGSLLWSHCDTMSIEYIEMGYISKYNKPNTKYCIFLCTYNLAYSNIFTWFTI